jgi:hypothetical protein
MDDLRDFHVKLDHVREDLESLWWEAKKHCHEGQAWSDLRSLLDSVARVLDVASNTILVRARVEHGDS